MLLKSKFIIADAMAPGLRTLATVERNKAFGVVLNSPIRLNGKLTTLKDSLSEDDAFHVTNLVLRRIRGEVVPELEVDTTTEEEEA